MTWQEMVNAVELAQKIELPYFCFDPEFVNLQVVYDQFRFAAECAYIAQDLFINDTWGCLDSELI